MWQTPLISSPFPWSIGVIVPVWLPPLQRTPDVRKSADSSTEGGTTRVCKQSTHTRKFTVTHIWSLTTLQHCQKWNIVCWSPPHPPTPQKNSHIFIFPQDFLWGCDVIYTSSSNPTNIWTVIARVYQSFTFFIFSSYYYFLISSSRWGNHTGTRTKMRKVYHLRLKYNVGGRNKQEALFS